MTIKTRASLQSFFRRGSRPTSAQFSDFVNSCIMLRANGSAVQTGIYEVESTASTTALGIGILGRQFIAVNTTAQAQQILAFTSASGAGGGAFGQDWLNANTTADAAPLLGSHIASNVLVSAGDTLYTDGSGLQRLAAGTSGQVLSFNSANVAPEWATLPPTLVSAGADTLSGRTFADRTIPTTAKSFDVMLSGVSTNGTSLVVVRIGSGTVESSGYTTVTTAAGSSVTSAAPTDGFRTEVSASAGSQRYGFLHFRLLNSLTNLWVCNGIVGQPGGPVTHFVTGSRSFTGPVDSIRITTVNGTDAFDGGVWNIQYH